YVYECACGKTYNDTWLALGHDYDDPVVDKEYTLTEHGLTSWHCKRCDYVVTRATYPQIDEIYFTVTLEIDGEVKTIRVKATDFITYSKQSDTTVTTDYVLLMNEIRSTFKDADDESSTYSRDNVTGIKIPLGITHVTNNGNGIRKIGSTLKTIDFSATYGLTVNSNSFENSTVLTDIIFGDNLTIGNNAFKSCTALTKIVVGDGLKISFGSMSFDSCSNLKTAEFGASEIVFNSQAFRTTTSSTDYTPLNSVKFSDGGTYTFGAKAFARTSITKLVLPDGATVKLLESNYNNTDAFWQCDFLTYVYLGEGTLDAGKMFDNCAGLQKVVLVGPEYIGEYGFCVGTATGESVGVLKVYIHKSNCTFGGKAFYKRSGIQVYTMSPITNGDVFNSCGATTKIVGGVSVSYPAYTIYYGIPHEYTAHTFESTCVKEGYDGYITDCPYCRANAEPDYENPVTYSVYEATTTNKTATSEVTLEKSNIWALLAHTPGAIVGITYENGFGKAGAYVRVCTVCANNYNAEDADAIFVALGYSAKKNNTSLYGGFVVNVDALNAYNSYLEPGKELKYGIIVSNVTGNDALTVADGVIDTNSVMAEIKDHTLNRIG
ncbi:MAG: leucine-rich repeat domain-containing protein, partial [Candidatus Coproplasma sp.]